MVHRVPRRALEELVKLVWPAWDRRFRAARVAESLDRLNQLQVVRKQRPYRLLPSLMVLVDNRREIPVLFVPLQSRCGSWHRLPESPRFA